MYKTRVFPVILGAAVILAALVALWAFASPANAQEGIRTNVGMGDLRLFEGQQVIPVTGIQESRHLSFGMGSLRRFESLGTISTSSEQGTSSLPVGIGDLRRFEAQQ
jgi:hypothetical protein